MWDHDLLTYLLPTNLPTYPPTHLHHPLLQVWDHDLLSRDDFIGEIEISLCPLMDARTHTYTLPLTDPEGKTGADDGLSGTITFELKYE